MDGSDMFTELIITVTDRKFNNGVPEYTCEVAGPGFVMINKFQFEKQNGDWKIINQIIEPAPAE